MFTYSPLIHLGKDQAQKLKRVMNEQFKLFTGIDAEIKTDVLRVDKYRNNKELINDDWYLLSKIN